jgi:hypothetical protein
MLRRLARTRESNPNYEVADSYSFSSSIYWAPDSRLDVKRNLRQRLPASLQSRRRAKVLGDESTLSCAQVTAAATGQRFKHHHQGSFLQPIGTDGATRRHLITRGDCVMAMSKLRQRAEANQQKDMTTTAKRPKPRRNYLRLTPEEYAAIERIEQWHAPIAVMTSEVLHLLISTGIRTLDAAKK